MTTDVKNTSLVAAGSLERLSALARARGTVRVIVGIRIAEAPEGAMDEETPRSRQNAIAAAQSAILAAVPIEARNSIKRFEFIPFLALEVTAQELDQLRRLPEVASIEEDKLSEPASGAKALRGRQ